MEYSEDRLNIIRAIHEKGITNRNFEEYCEGLGITPEDLSRKKILDIGSGIPEHFSQGAKNYGGEVVSVSPYLAKSKRHRSRLTRDPNWSGKTAAARVQDLPFRNDSFDMIVSSHAVPEYLPVWGVDGFIYDHESNISFSEIIRVLKIGGEARFSPIGFRLPSDASEEELILDELGEEGLNNLTSQGCEITIERNGKDNLPILVIKKPKK